MKFSLNKSLEILQATPNVLGVMLNDLSDDWIIANEGENTWSAKEVLAHLIICERTNWLVRVKIMLSDSIVKTLVPIDMAAHFELAKNSLLPNLLNEFKQLRDSSIKELNYLQLGENCLQKTAIHPTLGEVNLQQLIATWVTHDLSHITQISRVLAKQNKEHVGPFVTFLKILNR
jgi:uncharacterized damage-inducible protein DinB